MKIVFQIALNEVLKICTIFIMQLESAFNTLPVFPHCKINPLFCHVSHI